MNRSLPKVAFTTLILVLFFALLFALYQTMPSFAGFVDSQIISKIKNTQVMELGPFAEGSLEGSEENYLLEYNLATDAFNTYLNDTRESTVYWDNWNWETSLFYGDVLSVDTENQTVSLSIDNPSTLGQLNDVSVSCAVEETALYYYVNFDLLNTNINVFRYIEPGMSIVSQCKNELCTSVGNVCILVEKRNIFGDE